MRSRFRQRCLSGMPAEGLGMPFREWGLGASGKAESQMPLGFCAYSLGPVLADGALGFLCPQWVKFRFPFTEHGKILESGFF